MADSQSFGMTIFTICSNNYLAQAKVLGDSLQKINPNYNFKIFLCDKFNAAINYNTLGHQVIEIESFAPEISELAEKYHIIELNTAMKPRVIEFLFEHLKVEKVVYLDPDIFVSHSLSELENYLDHYSILLTPHVNTPIPLDGKQPSESLFLNYGIYNLGFIALNNDENSSALVKWWKNTTYTQGFVSVCNGLFVDQLPMNLAPLFFKGVKILREMGYNMAPWNLHERELFMRGDNYYVNDLSPLYFYHFSNFIVNSNELPLQNHNRFTLKSRPDLLAIHELYNQCLIAAKFDDFSRISCAYNTIYQKAIAKRSPQNLQRVHLLQRVITSIKKQVPHSVKIFIRKRINL